MQDWFQVPTFVKETESGMIKYLRSEKIWWIEWYFTWKWRIETKCDTEGQNYRRAWKATEQHNYKWKCEDEENDGETESWIWDDGKINSEHEDEEDEWISEWETETTGTSRGWQRECSKGDSNRSWGKTLQYISGVESNQEQIEK